MQLINRTGHAAGFFNTVIDEDRLLASVVCRSGFVVESDGTLVPADDDQVPPVDAEPWETPYGTMDGDQVFLRGGIDLLVFGQAHAPGGVPCRELELEIRAGAAFRRRLRIIGDRVWRKALGGPKPSEAEPFTTMPLTWERAFGGTVESVLGPVSEPANPLGRGYYLEKGQALGRALPNIEDPDHPVRSWNDRPQPVGVAPYSREWSLRVHNGIELGEKGDGTRFIKRFKPELLNNASPRMIVDDPLGPGDEIHVDHLTPEGALSFRLPEQAFHLHYQAGDQHHVIPLLLEAIGIQGDQRRVFLSWRTCFRYRLVPMERRAAELRPGPVPAQVPADYLVEWDPWSGEVLT